MLDRSVIYLDHAATSWPKPDSVIKAVTESLVGINGNAGRGAHSMALHAGRVLMKTRLLLAKLFQASNPNDFVFTSNATMALNMAIKGWLQPGDHVITTMLEHNSVRRPLEYLRRTLGIEVEYVQANPSGDLDMKQLASAFRLNTRLVICTHSSNLLGCILPIHEIAELAHRHGAVILVDAAQTAGVVPIRVDEMGIDMLAFPGHKGLLGPQGTGGLYVRSDLNLNPLLHGGTGSQSEEPEQPEVRPDRYEAGTANTPGIAGLGAGVEWVLQQGIEHIYEQEWKATQWIMSELKKLPDIRLLGPELGRERTGIVSFVIEGQDPAETAFRLDREYRIAVRAGYHCTPLGHETAGTKTTGAVRASVGYETTERELTAFVEAVQKIRQRS
ncbi:cysteine desulfurase [Paenibacillus sp. CAA11]|uniref:aminotransferase class V-fold PLP-dependent enzyme n=1 Tax=Paenibacillus sp. CAA11 TaxID=1532905 RepID=UPI000D337EC3|nr:aminotransferase class V-fold PLP-dependent enzyme [Paenibacillus sp. CAA11]AWB46712.1 cysteine desulfurase [Paenibacillus sp. CAA11]